MGRKQEVAELAKKVMQKWKEEEVERKGPQKAMSVTKKGEGRKEQDDCFMWFLGGRAALQRGRSEND